MSLDSEAGGQPGGDGGTVDELQERLGHGFVEQGLLRLALTHRSFRNEAPEDGLVHNERLEFLGDAVLGFLVSRKLYELYPAKTEGQLTRLRSALVSDAHLARKARLMELGRFMHLGRGEVLSGGRDKDSILAAAYESLIAAVYLDGGLEAARGLVEREFAEDIALLGLKPLPRDYKTTLKETLEAQGRAEPRYQVVETTGPDHRKRFHVAALVGGSEAGRGTGSSKKSAEQRAAKQALEALLKDSGSSTRLP